MEEEKLTGTKVLKVLGTYLLALYFTESLLDIIKNTSSSNFLSSSSNEKLQNYLLLAIYYIQTIQYLYHREIFPKSTTVITIYLNINRYKKPREFWRYVWINPYLFRLLIEQLETQPVFLNDSNNGKSQILIDKQLLTTMIYIGSYKNAASLAKISDLYEMEKGTIDKVCQQVWIAIQNNTLRTIHVG